ncbi:DUF4190 domain-containing protein [Arthrobacter sp. H5]|uniref:DUF4190 domain-containing protein n=1 Tax=Arthrobacter sp. H5 TaxID=1267973 RepID=UPI0004B7B504|nr:DUF4190 domain-containing protein [Arthrobacter sp. H5]
MSENTPGQSGQQDNDQSKYPAGQQWQQPAAGQQQAGGGYGAPATSQGAYPGGGGYNAPAENPGKTLGIVGMICAIIWPISIVGLIISIVALVKSKKAGMGNGFAIAGIVIGAIGVITGVIAIIGLIAVAGFSTEIIEFCETAGPGVQEYQGQQIDCSQLNP